MYFVPMSCVHVPKKREKYLKFHIKYFPFFVEICWLNFLIEFYKRHYQQKPINISNDFEEFPHQPRNFVKLHFNLLSICAINLTLNCPFFAFLFCSLHWYSWNLSLSTENLCPNYVKPIVFFGDTLKVHRFILQQKMLLKETNLVGFFLFFTLSLSHNKNGEDDSLWKYFFEPLSSSKKEEDHKYLNNVLWVSWKILFSRLT